jgi:hypothetical protein
MYGNFCSTAVWRIVWSLRALPRNSVYYRVGLFPKLLRSFSYTKKSDFFLCSGTFQNIKDRRSLMFVWCERRVCEITSKSWWHKERHTHTHCMVIRGLVCAALNQRPLMCKILGSEPWISNVCTSQSARRKKAAAWKSDFKEECKLLLRFQLA